MSRAQSFLNSELQRYAHLFRCNNAVAVERGACWPELCCAVLVCAVCLSILHLKVLRRLELILRCYAVKHQRTFGNIGYAQGMNFILGTCLSAGLSDEQCFWLLSSIVASVPLFNSKTMEAHDAEYRVLLEQMAR